MKISDYEKVQDLHDADAFLVDGDRGTKTILTTHLAKQIFSRIGSKELLDKATPSALPEDTQLEPTDLITVQTGDGMRKATYETFLNGVDALPKTSDEYFNFLDVFADLPIRNSVVRGKNVTDLYNWSTYIGKQAKGLFLADYVIVPELSQYPVEIVDFNIADAVPSNNSLLNNSRHRIVFMFRNGPNMEWNSESQEKTYYSATIRDRMNYQIARSGSMYSKLKTTFGTTISPYSFITYTRLSANATINSSNYLLLPSLSELYGTSVNDFLNNTTSIGQMVRPFALFEKNPHYLTTRNVSNNVLTMRAWTRDIVHNIDGDNNPFIFPMIDYNIAEFRPDYLRPYKQNTAQPTRPFFTVNTSN